MCTAFRTCRATLKGTTCYWLGRRHTSAPKNSGGMLGSFLPRPVRPISAELIWRKKNRAARLAPEGPKNRWHAGEFPAEILSVSPPATPIDGFVKA